MTDELVFYTNPMSRGRIVRWMLEEIGEPYRTEIVAYGPKMRSPDYLALNPMGKVPMVRRGKSVVTEAAAICAWLADVFPAAGLAPAPAERAAYYRWLFFGAGPVEAAGSATSLGFEPKSPDQQRQVGFGSLERVTDTLERAVGEAPYLAGDRFSAADVYLGSLIGWGYEFGPMEPRPALRHYVDRIRDREAYRRARAIDDAAAPSA
ncbi:MAG: glutathione S-transferase family protein [Geminicoccaceae bacterium]|jgi:glutathione S-transferase|nr:glutathione S-transferase family protein [Geminicoccaceae bacterium]